MLSDIPTPISTTLRPATREENRRLIRRAQRGDADACGELVLRNLGLVYSLVNRYRGGWASNAVERQDLEQVGIMGMLHAIRKFDLNRDIAFSTYAVWWVRQYLQRHVNECTYIAHVPSHVSGTYKRGRKITAEFERRNGRAPRPGEIQHMRGGHVTHAAVIPGAAHSLDEPIGEGATLWSEVTSDPRRYHAEVDERLDHERLRQMLVDAADSLCDQRTARIIKLRLGLTVLGGEGLSYREISQRLGIGRERVRQLYEDGMALIRRSRFAPHIQRYGVEAGHV